MTAFRGRTERKHALAGNGPIVDRARRALRLVAEQFGEVTGTAQTTVDVRTRDGIELTLSYDPGNYIFSRVYNLTISTVLPADCRAPSGVKVSHRDRSGARYVPTGSGSGAGSGTASSGAIPNGAAAGTPAGTPTLRHLNEVAGRHLDGIDLHSSAITAKAGRRTLTVTPLGGSYVWVLIPPVFKATAFPQGEPERILGLIRAVRSAGTTTDSSSPSQKGPAS